MVYFDAMSSDVTVEVDDAREGVAAFLERLSTDWIPLPAPEL
jgi:hypothetical protein